MAGLQSEFHESCTKREVAESEDKIRKQVFFLLHRASGAHTGLGLCLLLPLSRVCKLLLTPRGAVGAGTRLSPLPSSPRPPISASESLSQNVPLGTAWSPLSAASRCSATARATARAALRVSTLPAIV